MYCVKQGFKNIHRNRLFSLASIGTITCCLFLFGVFFSVIYNFRETVSSAEKNVGVSAFLAEGVTDEQIQNIKKIIELREEVESVTYISDEQAWEDFKPVLIGEDETSDALTNLENENPLEGMDSLTIYLKDTSKQDELVSYLESLPEIRKVNASETLADAFTSLSRLIGYASLVIIVILVAVAIFLISNTVTIGITARKEEIAIMKYIGATDLFVRGPFLVESVVIGLVGSAVPLVLLRFLYVKVVEFVGATFPDVSFLRFSNVNDVFVWLIPISLGIGLGIGLIGSWGTLRKHIRV